MSGRKISASVLLACVMLSAGVARLLAQTPMPTAIPPDRKAFTDANRIKEPDKKIEAMEKVIADFPRSQAVYSAHQAIFDTLVKSFPHQESRILASADKAIETAPEFIRTFICSSVGNRLFEAGIMLDDAERFLKKGLALTEEALIKSKKQQESGYYATLGRIYVKQGKLGDAEKNLKRARELNPQLSSAALGLAELYTKRGDEKRALESYTTAAVTTKLPAESRKQL
ncbi:MAG: tetratricopeptide repeat protein, partial [Blastocatellia bacterium]